MFHEVPKNELPVHSNKHLVNIPQNAGTNELSMTLPKRYGANK
jgi:hypothetical protein